MLIEVNHHWHGKVNHYLYLVVSTNDFRCRLSNSTQRAAVAERAGIDKCIRYNNRPGGRSPSVLASRESIMTLFDPILNAKNTQNFLLTQIDAAFVKAHGILFSGKYVKLFVGLPLRNTGL